MGFSVKNGKVVKYSQSSAEGIVRVPYGVLAIGSSSFSKVRLEELILPNTVLYIDDKAFRSTYLDRIVIPASVCYLGLGSLGLINTTIFIEGGDRFCVEDAARYASNVTMVYPEFSFAKLKRDIYRFFFARGFIEYPDLYSGAVREEYVRYLFRQRNEYLPIIYEKDAVRVLEIFAEAGVLKSTNYGSFYDAALQSKNPPKKCLFFLENWYQNNVVREAPENDVVKNIREILSDPYNVFEICKKWRFRRIDGGMELTAYLGQDAVVCIPERVGKETVIAVGDKVFERYKGFREVHLPCGMRDINPYVFSGCKNIKRFVVDPKNTFLAAVDGCLVFTPLRKLLRAVNGVPFPSSTPVCRIAYMAYNGVRGVREVHVPDSVCELSDYAFSGCVDLKKCTFGSGITALPDYAFAFCEKLEEVFLSDTVSYVGRYAFYTCKNLWNLSYTSPSLRCDTSAFYGCSKWNQKR